ncbi:bifunctional hydroxymethylpyrimidine kinase/phosphomethylpyrimidine kinase [Sulfurimonas aquatica]|uniref:hydroxymethylpyrimidine kinase n=1 Tax=Sulfurimonas aquatica TaxID=2672570 RepID=A0A975B0W3_9BACT|nr:bifunctional hydroxymethylpyrimidine kinase/phosphomethylpyrimidine kinase [Sulfurimonas aquatica]QSZ42164.1 bifunctional hydroxymethylpyrimidine kinase/phosphomethylpyrimidine kinase [Sulfurimonas aquatica]
MKVVLTIAGSDSSGGAGIQADLKTFEAFGLFGTSALTVLTAQNTTGVTDIQEVSPSFVKEQINAVLKDFDVAAIKIGMLYSKEIIEVVKESIKDLKTPIVLDPVFISKASSPLLKEDAVEAMKELFEYARVLTPNRYEAEALFGYEYGNDSSLESITNAPTAVLVKNHVVDTPEGKVSLDQLFMGKKKVAIQTPYLETTNLHGTGCSYSSAITANIALGHSLEVSIKRAKEFINLAIESAPNIGNGPGPINHKAAGEKVK